MDAIEYARELKLETTCKEDFGGTWNSSARICETEVGNIKLNG